MKYSIPAHMAFLLADGHTIAEPQIHEQLRQIEDGDFGGAIGYCGSNVIYSYATVKADTKDEAERIAWEKTGQAIRNAGYKATPGWFVEPPVNEEKECQYQAWLLRQELNEHLDDEGNWICSCADDPTHGDLIPLEHVRA